MFSVKMIQKFLIFLVALGTMPHGCNSLRLKITKITCNLTDPSTSQMEWCILKAESRYVQYLKLRFRVLQLPVNDFKIRVQIMKRLNGWKPFLYDVTVNCNFAKRLNKLTGFVWQYVRNVSNFNHSNCPNNQSVYQAERVDNKFVANALEMLPVPTGDYGVFVTIAVNKRPQGIVKAYGTIFD